MKKRQPVVLLNSDLVRPSHQWKLSYLLDHGDDFVISNRGKDRGKYMPVPFYTFKSPDFIFLYGGRKSDSNVGQWQYRSKYNITYMTWKEIGEALADSSRKWKFYSQNLLAQSQDQIFDIGPQLRNDVRKWKWKRLAKMTRGFVGRPKAKDFKATVWLGEKGT